MPSIQSEVCHKCGHLGHYAVACRSKSGKKVRQVVADKEQSTESDDSEAEFYIGTIKADIVNVNCERGIDIIDHTASTDTVISGDNKSETMSTQNNVDETENEHTDILSTEDNEKESTNAEVHNEETLNKLCDEPEFMSKILIIMMMNFLLQPLMVKDWMMWRNLSGNYLC